MTLMILIFISHLKLSQYLKNKSQRKKNVNGSQVLTHITAILKLPYIFLPPLEMPKINNRMLLFGVFCYKFLYSAVFLSLGFCMITSAEIIAEQLNAYLKVNAFPPRFPHGRIFIMPCFIDILQHTT